MRVIRKDRENVCQARQSHDGMAVCPCCNKLGGGGANDAQHLLPRWCTCVVGGRERGSYTCGRGCVMRVMVWSICVGECVGRMYVGGCVKTEECVPGTAVT